MKSIKFIVSALLSVIFLSACAIPLPMKTSDKFVSNHASETTAFVGITYAALGSDGVKNKIFRSNTIAVVESLSTHKGYLGHGVLINFFTNEAWTMTIWDNEANFNTFVRSEIHQKAIKEGKSAMRDSLFAKKLFNRKDLPLSWGEALQILKTEGYHYQ